MRHLATLTVNLRRILVMRMARTPAIRLNSLLLSYPLPRHHHHIVTTGIIFMPTELEDQTPLGLVAAIQHSSKEFSPDGTSYQGRLQSLARPCTACTQSDRQDPFGTRTQIPRRKMNLWTQSKWRGNSLTRHTSPSPPPGPAPVSTGNVVATKAMTMPVRTSIWEARLKRGRQRPRSCML